MTVWGNAEAAFQSTGQPPKWKSDAIQQLKAADYEQVAPYAIGGGPEAAYVLTHPLYLVSSDAENTAAYRQWLIDQNIYRRTGVVGAVDNVVDVVKSATQSHPQSFIALGIAALAVFIAWRLAK